MADYGLNGKVGVVTGAASGMGRATALAYAREGVKVGLLDLDAAGLAELEGEIKVAGGEALAVAADVAEEEQVKAAIDMVVTTFGGLDCAANCAGVAQRGARVPVQDTSTEEFDRLLAINLRGVFVSMKYELAHMAAAGAGAIVNIASASGLVAAPNISPYVASKFGVVGLTMTAALEGAPLGIRVNAVAPGGVATPLMLRDTPPELLKTYGEGHPANRLAAPEEIAETIVFLSSSLSTFMMGSVISIDGGYTAR